MTNGSPRNAPGALQQPSEPDVTVRKLRVFNEEARTCVRCRDTGLLHFDASGGHSRPILAAKPTGALGILVVGEAPNREDTYHPDKGFLTYTDDTDPTGQFMRALLIEEAGLRPHEIDHVLFTNAVLCLPRLQGKRHEVTSRQLESCKPWLERLIADGDIRIVVTMGRKALSALEGIERHGLKLRSSAGKLHEWRRVTLLPLYHAGRLGRIRRNEREQRADMRALRRHLGR